MRLAGEAEIAADLRKALAAVGQQAFRLFQLAAGDERAHSKSHFLLELLHNVRIASVDIPGYIIYGNRRIGVGSDIIDTHVDLLGDPFRNLRLAGTLAKIQYHAVLQRLDLFNSLQLFTFLHIQVDQLIRFLNIYASRNRTQDSDLPGCSDQ